MADTHRLSFERPIYELEARIQELEALSPDAGTRRQKPCRRQSEVLMKFAACGAS